MDAFGRDFFASIWSSSSSFKPGTSHALAVLQYNGQGHLSQANSNSIVTDRRTDVYALANNQVPRFVHYWCCFACSYIRELSDHITSFVWSIRDPARPKRCSHRTDTGHVSPHDQLHNKIVGNSFIFCTDYTYWILCCSVVLENYWIFGLCQSSGIVSYFWGTQQNVSLKIIGITVPRNNFLRCLFILISPLHVSAVAGHAEPPKIKKNISQLPENGNRSRGWNGMFSSC
jgi:hypothetical protein